MSSDEGERPHKEPRLSIDRRKDLTGEPVAIVVGPQEETFYVHEGPLRASSPYFDKALEPRWQGSDDRVVKLPDEEGTIVEMYIRWLYFDVIDAPPTEFQDALSSHDLNLVKAWVFADKILNLEFQNAIVRGIFKRINTRADDGKYWLFGSGAVDYAFEHTMKGAAIRRLFVDLYCEASHGQFASPWEEDEDTPFDFLIEAARELSKRPPRARALHPSDYFVNNQA